MTYFRINGESLCRACNYNNRIIAEAKRIYFNGQPTVAVEYVVKEMERIKYTPNKCKELHLGDENIRERRKALGVTGSFMARQMGYSVSRYQQVETKKQPMTEVFYNCFKKTEKKLKKLLTIKK